MIYLPVFLAGAVCAANLRRVHSAAETINESPRRAVWWALVLAASVLCISGYRTIGNLDLVKPWTIINHVGPWMTVVGCMGIVFLAFGSMRAQALLNGRLGQWLGRISFSLYLVHVPIIVTMAFALGGTLWWVAILLGIPLSLAFAAFFTWFIEHPAQRLAKYSGRWLADRFGQKMPTQLTDGSLSADGLRTKPESTDRV
jgi:peptidoglycan/LPS O-acetylase OafA/YrhL